MSEQRKTSITTLIAIFSTLLSAMFLTMAYCAWTIDGGNYLGFGIPILAFQTFMYWMTMFFQHCYSID